MALNPVSPDVYTDFSGFSTLKAKARSHSSEALEQVAKQFESVFMQMVLKSMREASLGDGIFDSDKSNFYRDMYDKQLSIHLSRDSRLGLAELITRQLGGRVKSAENVQNRAWGLDDYRAHPVQFVVSPVGPNPIESEDSSLFAASVPGQEAAVGKRFNSQDEFVESLRPYAVRAGRQLGVHPGVLLAQAALESGWGNKSIRHPGGQESHNLFGIKADSRWKGPSAAVSTLEYEGGIARRQRARFRSYQGFAASFQDYVHFIQNNARYSEALNSVGDPRKYVAALQKAGYATDPEYADKVMSIFDQQGLTKLSLDRS